MRRRRWVLIASATIIAGVAIQCIIVVLQYHRIRSGAICTTGMNLTPDGLVTWQGKHALGIDIVVVDTDSRPTLRWENDQIRWIDGQRKSWFTASHVLASLPRASPPAWAMLQPDSRATRWSTIRIGWPFRWARGAGDTLSSRSLLLLPGHRSVPIWDAADGYALPTCVSPLSLAADIGLTTILPVGVAVRICQMLVVRRVSRTCKRCGYSLAGLADSVCPECGTRSLPRTPSGVCAKAPSEAPEPLTPPSHGGDGGREPSAS